MFSAPFQAILDLRPWLPVAKLWYVVLVALIGLAWAWRRRGYGRFLRFSFACLLGCVVGLIVFELWWQTLLGAVGNDFDRRWLGEHDGVVIIPPLVHLFLFGCAWFGGLLLLIFKPPKPEESP